jgi:WS/DGAT/MGAT family acyltransferase
VKPLSGLDATFLYLEAPETPMHVGSLHLYEPPPGRRADFLARARRHIRSRLHLAPVFRRRLAALPLELASPMWVEDERVDLGYHLRRIVLPRPGTRAALEACVARLHSELLDRRRPLWRFYLIEGLASGHLAWYSKVHHAALDGAAGVQLANALLDVTPSPRKIETPRRPRLESTPGLGALVGGAFRNAAAQYVKLIRHLPGFARVLGAVIRATRGGARGGGKLDIGQSAAFGPRTPLNVAITAERTFATASIPLAEVKAIAARHGAKVNDVVLAIASGALRRYLTRHGGVPKRPLVAAMPISLREPGDAEYSTRATMTLTGLATHIADPIARLAAIRASAGVAKALTAQARSILPTDFPSLGVPWVLAAAAGIYGRAQKLESFPPLANVVISNVPGPRAPLYLAGAKMLTYWPASIVEHGLGLNITVQSYCGSLDFGLVAARKAVPDIGRLARALHESFEELRARSGSRASRTAVRRKPAKRRG